MNPTVEFGFLKATLLFFGLVFKALAIGEPLDFAYGQMLHDASAIVWFAFDGSFIYLLKPPTMRKGLPADDAGGK